jgi:predicted Zn-dependent peptidase
MAIYNKSITTRGVRVVSESVPNFHSVSIGIWVDIGSRDESPDENGVCHFIEHMMFKGTEKRSALEIASALESLGGNLNAFTSREQTCYYARVIDEHLPIAVDVLLDILTGSLFKEEHIEKERNVIVEEIKDVFDTPSDYIHDLFAKAFWDSNSLGNPIMGSTELISSMTRDTLMSFRNRNYTSGRIVVAAAGNVDHTQLCDLVEQKMGLEKQQPVAAVKSDGDAAMPTKVATHRDSNQMQMCIGFPGYRFTHPNKFALLIVHNILGAGMSSRLFQAVREKLGFAYSVYTYQDFLRDGGTFCVSLSTDKNNAAKSIDVILKELRKICDESITDKELDMSRQQLKGNLLLGLEGTSSRMNRLARHELGYNSYVSVEDTVQKIEAVTRDNVNEALTAVFDPKRCAAAFLGPVEEGFLDLIDWDIMSR